MSATIALSGSFSTPHNDLPVTTTLTLPAVSGGLLLVWMRATSASQYPTGVTFDSVTMTLIATAAATSGETSVRLYALALPASGTKTLRATVSGWTSVFGHWQLWQDTDGTRYGASFVVQGTSTNPTTNTRTAGNNGGLAAEFVIGYATSVGSISSGTSGASSPLLSSGTAYGSGYRLDDGSISWSMPNSFAWVTLGVPVLGTAPPAPIITGPTGAAGDSTSAVVIAENQTAIGTWTATDGGTWSISGGADAARVAINGSGVVTFVGGGKNFEAPDDADTNGTYLFTVQNANAGGTATQDVTVTLTDVNEPPGAPTIGTATAGNASASVAFTPPAANGGPTPTSYTATSSPGGITGTGASSPIAVSGLTNGVEYTFTVTATNAEGTGPASAVSNAVTPGIVTYTITSPSTFALNTGSNARPAGTIFYWWGFPGISIGDDPGSVTAQYGTGSLDINGLAVLSGLPVSGQWEIQVRFDDGGTARWTGIAI